MTEEEYQEAKNQYLLAWQEPPRPAAQSQPATSTSQVRIMFILLSLQCADKKIAVIYTGTSSQWQRQGLAFEAYRPGTVDG